MKKLILLFVSLFILFNTINAGLYVNKQNLSKLSNIKYIELVWVKQGNGGSPDVLVRYGEKENQLRFSGTLTKRNGHEIRFRNIYEALSYIRDEGWVDLRNFIQCYSGRSVLHFLFSKVL